MFGWQKDALLSFLPVRYVRNLTTDRIRGGVVGGVCESLAAVATLSYLGINHMRHAGLLDTIAPGTGPPMDMKQAFVDFATGPFLVLNFWFSPPAMICIYFMLEGATRAVSAGVARDPFPSLPFWLIGVIHDKLDSGAAARRLAPPSPDNVEPGRAGDAFDLRITSMRAKRDWHNNVTISYAGQVYEIASKTEAATDDAPPYIYCLRKKERIGAFRGIVYYDPFEFWNKK